jgi:uncharacterized protein YgiM (DUF1202 family)
MIRLIAGVVLGAFLAVAATESHAKTVTYYDAKAGTKVRKGPGQQYPVVYTIKDIDSVSRVGKSSAVDGKPKCKGGWCEVIAGAGRLGFIPQSALQTKTYKPSNDDEIYCYLFEDC